MLLPVILERLWHNNSSSQIGAVQRMGVCGSRELALLVHCISRLVDFLQPSMLNLVPLFNVDR